MGGIEMSSQILIRIDPETKEKLNRLARVEGKTTSFLVRELIEGYLEEHDISAYIDDLWKRIGKKVEANKIKPSDVSRAVKEVRRKKR
jgi:predicted DNA-binding protein